MRVVVGALIVGMLALASPARAQSPEIEQQIDEALSSLRPRIQVAGRDYPSQTLAQLMAAQHVPGVSIAVFSDGRILWAHGFGAIKAGEDRPVTSETLFQAASISKPVMATAALRLVEQGMLGLDRPVNEQLRSWRIPASEAAEGEPVTLRRLLTHTAGLTVSGFPGYEPDAALPGVVQILDGAAPANTPPIRVDQRPGSAWRYSGGGYTVAQLLLRDVTGEPFPDLMQRLVLAPAGMVRSSFRQPLPADRQADAAVAHHADGSPLPGGFHVYPELAAAGLWTTPSDIARWALALSAAFNGRNGLVRQETAIAMLTPGMGNWGLGPTVGGEGEWLSFSHGGVNEGFRARFLAFPRRGEGIVVMSNGDNGGTVNDAVVQAIGGVLGWPMAEVQVITPVAVPAAALADVAGHYSAEGTAVEIVVKGKALIAVIANGPPPFELIPQGDDSYVSEEGIAVRFVRDGESGRVTGVSTPIGTLPRIEPEKTVD